MQALGTGLFGLPTDVVSRIADANIGVDRLENTWHYQCDPLQSKSVWMPNSAYRPQHHFDRTVDDTSRSAFGAGIAYVRSQRQEFIEKLRNAQTCGDLELALDALGRALHALQDAYSHSNYADPPPTPGHPENRGLDQAQRDKFDLSLLGGSQDYPNNLLITGYDANLKCPKDPEEPFGDEYSHGSHSKDYADKNDASVASFVAAIQAAQTGSVRFVADIMNEVGTDWNKLKQYDNRCTDHPRKRLESVTSFDPNGKIGSQGVGTAGYISGEEPLRYTIFFENKETASAPAQEVMITDQLDVANLDLSSLSLGLVTFGNKLIRSLGFSQFNGEVDLRPTNNLVVKITGSLNTSTGILTWRFTSVDPDTGLPPADPLAGFLPPNKIPPEGEGSVLFTIMPKKDLASGTVIKNGASIIFDTNAPIVTPEWLNTIDKVRPASQVLPLVAVQTAASFNVQWQGADTGSGIGSYSIYSSDNGGPFTPWLQQTTSTQATFVGIMGHRYSFFSIARDLTGNQEDPKNLAEATTEVGGGADLSATLAASPNSVTTGSNLTYSLTVTNNGPSTASSITVSNTLTASTSFVSCSSTAGGVCTGSGNNRTITFASLAPGAFATAPGCQCELLADQRRYCQQYGDSQRINA
jgi:uncharacterized repeat protein (TIGR01451 family)